MAKKPITDEPTRRSSLTSLIEKDDETPNDPTPKETVECPQHKGYQLAVQVDAEHGIKFAVCNCNTRNNMFKGVRVWEQSIDPPTNAG